MCSKPSDRSGATRRYALSVGEARAQIVHAACLEDAGTLDRLEDIACLPRLAGWTPAILGAAIDRLVAAGLLEDSPSGALIVRARASRETSR